MNYWPRWINAITNKTAHLSLAAMGAYDRLLDHYYKTEAPLPTALDDCCRIVRATSKEERQAVQSVLAEFFTLGEHGYTQERTESEIAIAKPKIEAARANGERGGRPKGSTNKPTGFIEDNPTATGIDPRPKAPHPQTSSPSSKNNPPHPPPGEGRFAEFWNEWPIHRRKVAKGQCLAKWRTLGCEAISDVVLSALRAQKASPAWKKDRGEFIPAPLVWLNQCRWEAPTAEEEQGAHWTETRSGIEAKGASLGLGGWSEAAWADGGPSWPVYMARVYKAAGVELEAA